jgi:excisionase family DNA binding protein
MDKAYYNVEQVAKMLSIHPKTIQRYIREGKLTATKIGKSWRVSEHDLNRFAKKANADSNEFEAVDEARERTKASSVVDILVNNKDEAIRIINTLTAVMNMKPAEYGQASMHAQFIEQDNIVRFSLWGNIQFMSAILGSIEVYAEQLIGERR